MHEEATYFARRLRSAPPLRWNTMRSFAITFNMGSPVCITHPWISFDSLIAHLLLLDGLGDDYFITPKKLDLSGAWPKNRRLLPIKRTGQLYHASVSQFEPVDTVRVTQIYKRFETERSENLNRTKIRVGQGYFKSYALKQPYVPAQRVRFFVHGDVDLIGNLIDKYLIGLGNDTRIGFGTIRSWKIEETDGDWSIIWNGIAMRPIPVEMCEEWEDEAMLAWKAPYWSPRNVTLCVPPGARCRLK